MVRCSTFILSLWGKQRASRAIPATKHIPRAGKKQFLLTFITVATHQWSVWQLWKQKKRCFMDISLATTELWRWHGAEISWPARDVRLLSGGRIYWLGLGHPNEWFMKLDIKIMKRTKTRFIHEVLFQVCVLRAAGWKPQTPCERTICAAVCFLLTIMACFLLGETRRDKEAISEQSTWAATIISTVVFEASIELKLKTNKQKSQ